jgi:hypothetical protein
MAVTIALLQWSLEKPHMKQVGQLSVYKASNSMHLMHNDNIKSLLPAILAAKKDPCTFKVL